MPAPGSHYRKPATPRGPKLKVFVPGATRRDVKPRPCLGNVGAPHPYANSTPAERICGKCRSVIDARVRLLSPMALECRAPDPAGTY